MGILASSSGHIEIVRRLLKAGANPKSLKTSDSTTAMDSAKKNNYPRIVEVLKEAIEAKERKEESLQAQTEEDKDLLRAVESGNLERVKALVATAWPHITDDSFRQQCPGNFQGFGG